VVRCVDPTSLAVALGLQPGDRLVAVGPWAVNNPYELDLALRRSWPHTETVFHIERGGAQMELSLLR
jgi:S1-C subfamily serine protease